MALSGTGVGGGSLVYAAVLLDPLPPFFSDPQWAHLDEDWESTLAPHYQKAKHMLGVATTPRLWDGDRLLEDYAKEIGRSEHFAPNPVGIFFNDDPGSTVPDPFFGGDGPRRTSCDFSAACMVGCRTGGKNTLDKNYLWFAEKHGARIVPGTRVTAIRPDGQGGYVVDSHRSGSWFRSGRRTWRAQNVVVSAGTLGTLDLLLDCRDRAYLPYLSDSLGQKFRTNSEVICGAQSLDADADFSQGVAIASGVQVNENTSIELVRYNRGSDVMGFLSTVLVDKGSWLTRPLKWAWQCVTHPVAAFRTHIPFGWARRTVILLVMQVLDNSLRLVYRRSWLRPWRKVLRCITPEGGIPSYIVEANDAAKAIAGRIDGIPSSAWSEVLLNRPLTAHVIGGCCMGSDAHEGVVDKYGRVFGHQGLYVVDGSIVSANLGVNPSLTITALAEHVMSAIPQKDDGEEERGGEA